MLLPLCLILSLIAAVLILTQLGFLKIALFLGIFIALALFLIFMLTALEAYRVIFIGNAPYVGTSKKIIRKILTEIKFEDNAAVCELGCGNAKFLRAIAKSNKVRAIGYEYSLILYLQAIFFNFFANRKIQAYLQDFFKADLSRADYVFCFLMPEEMARLENKLKRELKPNALVISNSFPFKKWQPEKVIELDKNKKNSLNNRLYLYRQKLERNSMPVENLL